MWGGGGCSHLPPTPGWLRSKSGFLQTPLGYLGQIRSFPSSYTWDLPSNLKTISVPRVLLTEVCPGHFFQLQEEKELDVKRVVQFARMMLSGHPGSK